MPAGATSHPTSPFGQEAADYVHAITAPSTVLDVEILLKIFRLGKGDIEGNVTSSFAGRIMSRAMKPQKILEKIRNCDYPVNEKAFLATNAAYMVYIAGDIDLAMELFEEVLATPEYEDQEVLGKARSLMAYFGRGGEEASSQERAEAAGAGMIPFRRIAQMASKVWSIGLARLKPAKPIPVKALARACGPVVLREACQYLDVPMSKKKSVQLCGLDEGKRTTFWGLAQAFRSKGLTVEAKELGARQLPQVAGNGDAVIAHMNDHFAVVRRVGDDKVTLLDDRGEYELPLRAFYRRWDGYVLIVSKRA